jgi:hypothetical protein
LVDQCTETIHEDGIGQEKFNFEKFWELFVEMAKKERPLAGLRKSDNESFFELYGRA